MHILHDAHILPRRSPPRFQHADRVSFLRNLISDNLALLGTGIDHGLITFTLLRNLLCTCATNTAEIRHAVIDKRAQAFTLQHQCHLLLTGTVHILLRTDAIQFNKRLSFFHHRALGDVNAADDTAIKMLHNLLKSPWHYLARRTGHFLDIGNARPQHKG